MDTVDPAILTPVRRLTRDIRQASATLGVEEARFLVDAYYQMQDSRIRAKHQERTLGEDLEPNSVLSWLGEQNETLEVQVKGALGRYAAGSSQGQWLLSICGIGPVIASGLLCHIDVEKAKTAGQVWRFAGLDPTVRWDKGQKRPWNAALKRLCFLLAESFVKVKSNPNSVYAPLYDGRKALEQVRNERGEYADQARLSLETKHFRKDTEARKHYLTGRLPPARIHMRALRYMVKIFLADYHAVATWCERKELPPVPYILNQPGHVHHSAPPNMGEVLGLEEAWLTRNRAHGLVAVSAEEQGVRMGRK